MGYRKTRDDIIDDADKLIVALTAILDDIDQLEGSGPYVISNNFCQVSREHTFRLLDTLQKSGLLGLLRERVRGGACRTWGRAPTNITAPTIRTTNDMPIVEPAGFEALGLLPFQINPHYLDPDPGSRHMGETREERIREFLEENDVPVLGLREGAWLTQQDAALRLEGHTARLFRRGRDPEELAAGADLDFLL